MSSGMLRLQRHKLNPAKLVYYGIHAVGNMRASIPSPSLKFSQRINVVSQLKNRHSHPTLGTLWNCSVQSLPLSYPFANFFSGRLPPSCSLGDLSAIGVFHCFTPGLCRGLKFLRYHVKGCPLVDPITVFHTSYIGDRRVKTLWLVLMIVAPAECATRGMEVSLAQG